MIIRDDKSGKKSESTDKLQRGMKKVKSRVGKKRHVENKDNQS